MKNKQYTPYELMYICKFYEVDGPGMMAAAFDRSMKSIAELVRKLRKNGLYDHCGIGNTKSRLKKQNRPLWSEHHKRPLPMIQLLHYNTPSEASTIDMFVTQTE